MDGAVLGAKLLLAAVFAVAGVAKLLDLAGSRRAVAGFGIPEKLVAPLGLVLPIVELAVAAALIPLPSAPWGAAGALLLLLLFIAGIGASLARGQAPDCHCFGQLYSEPVGRGTLARNALLALLAAGVLVASRRGGGLDLLAWAGDLSSAERVGVVLGVAALGLLGAQCWLLFRLIRQNAQLAARLEAMVGGAPRGDAASAGETGLPTGSRAPELALPDLHGDTVTLADLRSQGKPVVLFFTNPQCGPCNALLPEIGSWQRAYGDRLTFAILTTGGAGVNRGKSVEHGLDTMLMQRELEIEDLYQVRGTPAAVVVGPDGLIQSPVEMGAEAIRSLVQAAAGRPPPPLQLLESLPGGEAAVAAPTLHIGDPAPDLEVTDLAGGTAGLASYPGRDTVLLFWNTGCGFCQQMEPELLAWEAAASDEDPALLVVLPGTAPGNGLVRFRSPVVIDRDGSVFRTFGAHGTPMAILLGADGRVRSEIAAGAAGVLALLHGDRTRAEIASS